MKSVLQSVLVFGPESVSYERSWRVQHAKMRVISARVFFGEIQKSQDSIIYIYIYIYIYNIRVFQGTYSPILFPPCFELSRPGRPPARPSVRPPARPGTQNISPGTQDASPGTQNTSPGTQNTSPGTQNTSPGTQNISPDTQNISPDAPKYVHNHLMIFS